jgi:hypothetical protein
MLVVIQNENSMTEVFEEELVGAYCMCLANYICHNLVSKK